MAMQSAGNTAKAPRPSFMYLHGVLTMWSILFSLIEHLLRTAKDRAPGQHGSLQAFAAKKILPVTSTKLFRCLWMLGNTGPAKIRACMHSTSSFSCSNHLRTLS